MPDHLDGTGDAAITANTYRFLRDMCRTYGLRDPVPLTWRDKGKFARMQAEIAIEAFDTGNYSAALAYIRDAERFLTEAVRMIGEEAKDG